ncbi:hypothetical protein [Cytobacillus firmus]|uniref:hypothetical protein n=1 Tax=Cytobacillus firmus TaxID=1399 RepID=UPI0018CDC31A|nr:hypothetical protein [Cytobacillus firmus]MED1904855.1 hypothetical protein [Cytobacillus firmus]MED1938909.1 hypothetical protein [Cytobacillus firmus]
MNVIKIVSISIDSHSVTVPVGLSELLAGTWVKNRKPSDVMKEYDRQVIQRDGQIVTRLTKRNKN